jgi:hypothetical protein
MMEEEEEEEGKRRKGRTVGTLGKTSVTIVRHARPWKLCNDDDRYRRSIDDEQRYSIAALDILSVKWRERSIQRGTSPI